MRWIQVRQHGCRPDRVAAGQNQGGVQWKHLVAVTVKGNQIMPGEFAYFYGANSITIGFLPAIRSSVLGLILPRHAKGDNKPIILA
jgi:hypothetical protein